MFVIYGADLEDWLKHSAPHTYADDTKTSVTAKRLEEIKKKLEEDARQVLKFMASNGLKANSTKNTLLIINGKKLLTLISKDTSGFTSNTLVIRNSILSQFI